MELEIGTILRNREDCDLWRVVALTAKSAYLARCDAKGKAEESPWRFLRSTVERDFFPS